jgi:hypothetical protein
VTDRDTPPAIVDGLSNLGVELIVA